MTSFAAFEPLTSDEGVTFTPWTDGHAVGFRITREQDDRVEYVVLSPSSAHNRPDWEGRGDVFVYRAIGADAEADVYGSPACFLDVFDPADYPDPEGWLYDSAHDTATEQQRRAAELRKARPDADVTTRTSDGGLFEVYIRLRS